MRTRRLLLTAALFWTTLLVGPTLSPAPARVRINGSTTVNPVVVDAAKMLRSEEDIEILIDTVGGSSGGIAALGDGRIEIAMSSRPLSDDDRRRFPRTDFRAVRIGVDALALVVSRDVWEAGVHSLSPEQIRDLYEGRVRSWREVGGPDRRVVFFNKEPGRGTWEVFVNWLYQGADHAPFVNLPEVGSNEEGRNKVASTPGSITQLSAAWADGEQIFALGLRTHRGRVIYPTEDRIVDGSYPLARSLFVISDGLPRGETALVIGFLTSSRGQQLVTRHGFSPLPAFREDLSP